MKQGRDTREPFELWLNIDPGVIYTYLLGIYRPMKLLQRRLPIDPRLRAEQTSTRRLPS
jgi:hypothetical protein